MNDAAQKDEMKERFRSLLRELNGKDVSPETRERAKTALRSIDAKTLGEVEQEIIREGISHGEIRSTLCDIHLEAVRDSLVDKRATVEAPHPVNTLMEEHGLILGFLKDLGSFLGDLERAQDFEYIEPEMKKLRNIAHHLVEAEKHHQREEEALFPALESHGIEEPPRIMRMDHVELRERKKALHELSVDCGEMDFGDFRDQVMEAGSYMVKELGAHIFKEDNILYQMALQVLSDEEWADIRRKCDEIGYCCFTPNVKNDTTDATEVRK